MGVSTSPRRIAACPRAVSAFCWRRLRLLLGLLLVVLAGCGSARSASGTAGRSGGDKAEEYFQLGQKYLQVRNYPDAARYFDLAARQAVGKYTTVSLYLAGVAYYKSGQLDRALEQLQNVVKRYPESRYVDEAQYHKALILMDRPDSESRKGGLYVLLNLLEQTRNSSLKADAEAALKEYYFNRFDAVFLGDYLQMVRPGFRTLTFEALLYHLRKAKRDAEAERRLREYRQAGGEMTPRLDKLARGVATTPNSTGGAGRVLKVAVLLPFQTHRPDTLRDASAQLALELFEGMQVALSEARFPGIERVELKVFDTRGDSVYILRELRPQVEAYRPDLLVGDIRNRPSRAIAQLAASLDVAQLVPLSDSEEMTRVGAEVLLANPTEGTAAQKLGEFVRTKLAYRKVLVLYDGSSESQRLADRFVQGMKLAPGSSDVNAVKYYVAPGGDQAIRDLTRAVSEIGSSRYEAVYAPLSNEQSVSWLLFKLDRDSVDVQVLGTDKWRAYRKVDRDLYFKRKVILTDAYEPGNDSLQHETFRTAYLSFFKGLPTLFVAQGYDVMRMALFNLGSQPAATGFLDAMHQARPYRGLMQNFYYGAANSNQSVQVLQYDDGQLKRLVPW